MKKSPFLARLENEIVAVAPDRQQWFESCLTAIQDHPEAQKLIGSLEAATSEDDGFWPAADDWRAAYRPYTIKAGVLLVPVMGVLLNRFPYQLGHWATGYTYIERAVRRGMEDPNVKGIAFICDSPGGEVSGNFELVDKIFSYRGQKPMRAFASDRAYSAAYSIASAADKITMTRSGGVGSIGIVTLHLDYSEQMRQMGVKATFMFKGKWKKDGNSLEPLSAHAKQRIDSRLERAMDIFVASVSRNRGLEAKVVRDTEADSFGPEEAIALGLADKIEVFDEALIAFCEGCSSGSGEDDMTKENDKAAITQEQLDSAVASAKAEGLRDGAQAEKTRIVAIMGSDAAKTRQKAALSAALKTEMTADQASAFIADLPEDKAAAETPEGDAGSAESEAGKALFEAAMKDGNPGVGAGSGKNKDGVKDDSAVASSLIGDYLQASGTPRKQAA